MRGRFTIKRECTCGCRCPTVRICQTCGTKTPYTGVWGGPCQACEERQRELQQLQRDLGERYWREIGPIIETWEMAVPGGDD